MELEKGFFITFEGADGCGKTTQAKLVKELLDKLNVKNILTREPGSGEMGKSLRQILLHYDKPVATMCEIFLYLADRAQHVEYEIVPKLAENFVVLCDRYTDSTVSYQGYGRGEGIEELNYLNKLATGGLLPDLTFVFDVDSEVAQNRLGGEKDRLEALGLEFHKKVREGYLELAKKEPERIVVIDANRDIDEVFQDVKKAIEGLLSL